MHAAVLRIELRIPGAQSLKAKRAVLRPLVEGMKRLASLSVAEVDHHDVWQRAAVGVAAVAPDQAHLDRLLSGVRRYLDECFEVEVLEIGLTYLEEPS